MRSLVPVMATILVGCGGSTPEPHELPASEAQQYATAYIAVVVADVEGDDLKAGAGEHVVIRNNWDRRTDMGGWYVTDVDDNRLPLGVGRQIDPGAEVRLYSSCGEDTEEAVFACVDDEVLDDDRDELTLRDSAGSAVATFAYGSRSD